MQVTFCLLFTAYDVEKNEKQLKQTTVHKTHINNCSLYILQFQFCFCSQMLGSLALDSGNNSSPMFTSYELKKRQIRLQVKVEGIA